MSSVQHLSAPEEGKHSFAGLCAPGERSWPSQAGFSVGVFQWVPTIDGQGLKKSAVKVRVKGLVGEAEKVYAKAREVCQQLDAGEAIRQKSITV